MFAALDAGSLWTKHFIQRAHECICSRRPLDWAVDAQRDPAGRGARVLARSDQPETMQR
jgi:hypothetical protein